jgi:glycosyltransferase involved in cell wall biosynthesis
VRNEQLLRTQVSASDHVKMVFIDTEKFAGPLHRLATRLFPNSEHGVSIVSSLDYFLFDWLAYRRLLGKTRQQEWNLVHRVTPVTLSAPTWFCRGDLPVLIGPLNSGLSNPPGFEHMLDRETKLLSHLARRTAQLLDALLGSNKRASKILVGTSATLSALPFEHHHKAVVVPENGVDLELFGGTHVPHPTQERAPDSPLQVLFVGRLQRVKGVNLLLDAIATLRDADIPVELTLIGEGSMRQAWQAQARELGIESQVTFKGAKPHSTVARAMWTCDVFCLPSVRESGGAVLLEAMACGKPVIALDFGGPRDFVTHDVGRLLPMTNPKEVTKDLARALKDAWENPGLWRIKGMQGRHVVEKQFSWPEKIRTVLGLYDKILTKKVQP